VGETFSEFVRTQKAVLSLHIIRKKYIILGTAEVKLLSPFYRPSKEKGDSTSPFTPEEVNDQFPKRCVRLQ